MAEVGLVVFIVEIFNSEMAKVTLFDCFFEIAIPLSELRQIALLNSTLLVHFPCHWMA